MVKTWCSVLVLTTWLMRNKTPCSLFYLKAVNKRADHFKTSCICEPKTHIVTCIINTNIEWYYLNREKYFRVCCMSLTIKWKYLKATVPTVHRSLNVDSCVGLKITERCMHCFFPWNEHVSPIGKNFLLSVLFNVSMLGCSVWLKWLCHTVVDVYLVVARLVLPWL